MQVHCSYIITITFLREQVKYDNIFNNFCPNPLNIMDFDFYQPSYYTISLIILVRNYVNCPINLVSM